MKQYVFLILFFLTGQLAAQDDSVRGRAKTVREELLFFDSSRLMAKLFPGEGDFGHYGFSTPEKALERFHNAWFHTYWVHYINYVREYDTLGRLKQDAWYYRDGSRAVQVSLLYDDSSNLVQRKSLYNLSKEPYTEQYYYNYLNQKLSYIYYYPDDVRHYGYEMYQYDTAGRLIASKGYYESGETGSMRYRYTKDGRLAATWVYSHRVSAVPEGSNETTLFSDAGSFRPLEEYLYDGAGRLVKSVYYIESSGKEPGYRAAAFEYDSAGNKTIEYLSDNGLPPHACWRYSYANGLLKSKQLERLPGNKAEMLLEYSYNTDRTVSRLVYTGNGVTTIVDFRYRYDQRGNWTEQIKSINGKDLYRRVRELVYY